MLCGFVGFLLRSTSADRLIGARLTSASAVAGFSLLAFWGVVLLRPTRTLRAWVGPDFARHERGARFLGVSGVGRRCAESDDV